jgi:hypothetical protein
MGRVRMHACTYICIPGAPIKLIDFGLAFQLGPPTMRATEVCGVQLDSTRLDSTRLDSTRLDLPRLASTRLDSTRLDSTRLDSTWLDLARLDSFWLDLASPLICALVVYLAGVGVP